MNTFIDPRDKREYQTVQIGDQIWMAENLNFVCKGSCSYQNNEEYSNIHGRIYDWKTALKSAPSGWRLPSHNDFKILTDFLGGDRVAFDKLLQGGSSGFNATFSGWRDDQGYFQTEENFAKPGEEVDIKSTRFWSSTKCDPDSGCKDHAHYFAIEKCLHGNYSSDSGTYTKTAVYPIRSFFSVRCIKRSDEEQGDKEALRNFFSKIFQ